MESVPVKLLLSRGWLSDTKREEQPEQASQVLEKMVELVGIEPTTSSLRTITSTTPN